MAKKNHSRIKKFRTIWISDVHLGTPGCKAEHLVDFLKHTECENLYLVGDIIDGWKLRSVRLYKLGGSCLLDFFKTSDDFDLLDQLPTRSSRPLLRRLKLSGADRRGLSDGEFRIVGSVIRLGKRHATVRLLLRAVATGRTDGGAFGAKLWCKRIRSLLTAQRAYYMEECRRLQLEVRTRRSKSF